MSTKTKSTWKIILPVFLVLVLVLILVLPKPIGRLKPGTNSDPTATISATEVAAVEDMLPIALAALSSERLFATVDDLTNFQPHSGWRGSATSGEAEALDYLQSRLENFSWLKSSGLTVESESFNVFTGTEDHASSLFLPKDGLETEIPADAIRGNRDDLALTLQMDSDAVPGDLEENPVIVQGHLTLIADKNMLDALSGSLQTGRILFVDYSLVNTVNYQSAENVKILTGLNPAAVVLVSTFSNDPQAAPATTIGDGGGVFQKTSYEKNFPLLFIEKENLAPLGINSWEDMTSFTAARVKWDNDVLNPAPSGNLIVHVPGRHTDKAVLVSAHIDSANSPGALDDGSGSAILMEILTILEETHIKPDVDLYLAWFGSEELGIYGSTYFTTTHSELISRLQAVVQLDCLTRPLDGLPSKVTLMVSHTPNNLYSDPLVKYMLSKSKDHDIPVEITYQPFASDNGSFTAFRVPNMNIINESSQMNDHPGGVWAAGHLHDPYDTLTRVREMEETFLNMARLGLAAALVPYPSADFNNVSPEKKVVFLANHTEAPQMTPAGFVAFSQALEVAGYEISVIPYGAALSSDSIASAELVVALPVYDFPIMDDQTSGYDTGWTREEAAIIDAYVRNGGKLLVVNCGARLKLVNRVMDLNEDWSDLNLLTEQWGVHFTRIGARAQTINAEDRGIMSGVSAMIVTPETAVEFETANGKVLAGMDGADYMALLEVGKGQVLILSDMTVLGDTEEGPLHEQLLINLANWK